jgi:hypothetical protein
LRRRGKRVGRLRVAALLRVARRLLRLGIGVGLRLAVRILLLRLAVRVRLLRLAIRVRLLRLAIRVRRLRLLRLTVRVRLLRLAVRVRLLRLAVRVRLLRLLWHAGLLLRLAVRVRLLLRLAVGVRLLLRLAVLRLLRLLWLAVGVRLLLWLAVGVRLLLRLTVLRLLWLLLRVPRLLWLRKPLLLRGCEPLLLWRGRESPGCGLARARCLAGWLLCSRTGLLARVAGDDGSGMAEHRLGWLLPTRRPRLHGWHRSAARSARRRIHQHRRPAVRAWPSWSRHRDPLSFRAPTVSHAEQPPQPSGVLCVVGGATASGT